MTLGHCVAGVSTWPKRRSRTSGAYPDVLMTDVGLPAWTASSCSRRSDAGPSGSWIPNLVFTGSLDRATQMQALEAGADAYLCKPASREMLRAKLG